LGVDAQGSSQERGGPRRPVYLDGDQGIGIAEEKQHQRAEAERNRRVDVADFGALQRGAAAGASGPHGCGCHTDPVCQVTRRTNYNRRHLMFSDGLPSILPYGRQGVA